MILELTNLDIKTNGKLNDIQRVQLDLYKKIYLLLKKVNLLREENNGVRKGFNQLQSNWNSLREWLKKDDNVYICYSSQKSNKTFEAGVRFGLTFALDKMDELEGKDKDENN